MPALKPALGMIGTIFPILYCAYLIHYFLGVAGSVENAEMDGLGPTLLGLGIVGLFFCIVLIVKLLLIFGRPRSPGSGGRGGPGSSPNDDGDGFDADAAVARYLARQAAETASGSSAAPPATEGGGPTKRPSFGRKSK